MTMIACEKQKGFLVLSNTGFQLTTAKGFSLDDNGKSFEKTGLSGSIAADNQIDIGIELQRCILQISEVRNTELLQGHGVRA